MTYSLFSTVTTYCIYAFFRLYGMYGHKHWAQDLGIDFLAVIAGLMFSRLAFITLNNNLMVSSLRAMMMQSVALMLIIAFCFCDFLYALWTLSWNHARCDDLEEEMVVEDELVNTVEIYDTIPTYY
ncbi:hypothetical protein EDD22DRAFT_994182 [Suillus occidentalis]|nr:hypothetical protein EDD22DRAFT_994182 [Suillus occidentalis]